MLEQNGMLERIEHFGISWKSFLVFWEKKHLDRGIAQQDYQEILNGRDPERVMVILSRNEGIWGFAIVPNEFYTLNGEALRAFMCLELGFIS